MVQARGKLRVARMAREREERRGTKSTAESPRSIFQNMVGGKNVVCPSLAAASDEASAAMSPQSWQRKVEKVLIAFALLLNCLISAQYIF